MKKIALVGGPSTGKSSTFKDLQKHLPDSKFHPEAAREIIQEDPSIIERQQDLQTKINQRII